MCYLLGCPPVINGLTVCEDGVYRCIIPNSVTPIRLVYAPIELSSLNNFLMSPAVHLRPLMKIYKQPKDTNYSIMLTQQTPFLSPPAILILPSKSIASPAWSQEVSSSHLPSIFMSRSTDQGGYLLQWRTDIIWSHSSTVACISIWLPQSGNSFPPCFLRFI